MEKDRLKRYEEKIEIILDRKMDIEEWIEPYEEDISIRDKMTRFAVYKAMQEAVEASLDIAAMAVKDIGKLPKDDFTNVEILVENKIIDDKLARVLNEANGLRNILVHSYNKVDDIRAFRSIKGLTPHFERFSEVIKKWTKGK
jgi:uncharacterized protein YutE (UPF0331/DUF86 family)